MSISHVSVEPAILYLGTPVVLVSSTNEDGSPNLAPMSSAFWLGWRCMLDREASQARSVEEPRSSEIRKPSQVLRPISRSGQPAAHSKLISRSDSVRHPR
jgi:hypothetical protein